jgi:hypothetical protein
VIRLLAAQHLIALPLLYLFRFHEAAVRDLTHPVKTSPW